MKRFIAICVHSPIDCIMSDSHANFRNKRVCRGREIKGDLQVIFRFSYLKVHTSYCEESLKIYNYHEKKLQFFQKL